MEIDNPGWNGLTQVYLKNGCWNGVRVRVCGVVKSCGASQREDGRALARFQLESIVLDVDMKSDTSMKARFSLHRCELDDIRPGRENCITRSVTFVLLLAHQSLLPLPPLSERRYCVTRCHAVTLCVSVCVCVPRAAYIMYQLHAALVLVAKVMRCIQCSLVIIVVTFFVSLCSKKFCDCRALTIIPQLCCSFDVVIRSFYVMKHVITLLLYCKN